MSETRCACVVSRNTLRDSSVKFQFLESMTPDPMSIHAHAAPDDRARMGALSVRLRRRIGIADMSETTVVGTVVLLTVRDGRDRMARLALELSCGIAFRCCEGFTR